MKKKILILGSTGSIGVNTLRVVDEFPDEFEVSALSTNSNIKLLEEQIEKYNPLYAVVINPEAAVLIGEKYKGKCRILTGAAGLIEITRNSDYDIFLNALVGFAGLAPTIEAIKLGKRIALANKETLVVAGEIINALCNNYKAEMIPVDSEHSAIFQCLVGENYREIKKLMLTASGGPFFNKDFNEFNRIKPEDALKHPNWKMGNKITIDSATMMNKGLEIIEAHWLFKLPKEKLEVLIHPQSIIHSMVEFVDSSIKAQLSMPDMKLPIQYAMTYPERKESKFVDTDFIKIGKLEFFEPDFRKFECLKLAYESLEAGGVAPCILNAANEVAVEWFLDRKIEFLDIPKIINKALDKIPNIGVYELETIFESDRQTREFLLNNGVNF